MPQLHGSASNTGPVLVGVALLLMLGGCSAIYEDTKGWANRLEASVLEAAHELNEDPDAGEPERYTPEAVEEKAATKPATPAPAKPAVAKSPAAMKSDPAVPTVPPAALPAKPAQPAPEGVMAAASDSLVKAADDAKAAPAPEAPQQPKTQQAQKKQAQTQQALAVPPLPKAKPPIPARPGTTAAPAPDSGPDSSPDSAPNSDVAMVVHLASLRSEQAAKREWHDLQTAYPDNLGRMQAQITRTELGEKGIFYRVLAGPLPTRSAARQTCATLKQKSAKQYCQVMPVKPAS